MLSDIQLLLDKTAAGTARVSAAESLGTHLGTLPYTCDDAWRAVCTVVIDADDDVTVRLAALRALAMQRAAAPNQLVRGFRGDPHRALRKEAFALLRSIGAPLVLAHRLDEELAKTTGPDPVLALANLALTFGYDARVVAAYRAALLHSQDTIRVLAIRGLAMLGELTDVMEAVRDPAVVVRSAAAEMLGIYGTLENAELRALGLALQDTDSAVEKTAKTALRRLGVSPMAAPPAKKGRKRKPEDESL